MITLRICDVANPAGSVLAGPDQRQADAAFHHVWSLESDQDRSAAHVPCCDPDEATAARSDCSECVAIPANMADPGIDRRLRTPGQAVGVGQTEAADKRQNASEDAGESGKRKDLQANRDNTASECSNDMLPERPSGRDVDRWADGAHSGRLVAPMAPYEQRQMMMTGHVAQIAEQTGLQDKGSGRTPFQQDGLAKPLPAGPVLHAPGSVRPAGPNREADMTGPSSARMMQGHSGAMGGIGGGIAHDMLSVADRVRARTERIGAPLLRDGLDESGSERGPTMTPREHVIRNGVAAFPSALVAQGRLAAQHMRLAPDAWDPVETDLVLLEPDEGSDIQASVAGDMTGGGAVRATTDTLVWSPRVRLAQFQTDIRGPLAALVAAKGTAAVQITLDPAELGLVRIALHPGDTGLQVQILAERVETLDLMRRFAYELARDLARMGFDDVAMEFSHQDRRDGSVWERGSVVAGSPDPDSPEIEEIPGAQYVPTPESGMDLRI